MKKKHRNITIKLLVMLICFGFISFIFLTDSRNALLGFLISIPILGAVTIFGLKNILITESQYEAKINIFAICFAFLFSLITIKFFLKYLNKFSLNIFVYYRVLLGIVLLFLAYS